MRVEGKRVLHFSFEEGVERGLILSDIPPSGLGVIGIGFPFFLVSPWGTAALRIKFERCYEGTGEIFRVPGKDGEHSNFENTVCGLVKSQEHAPFVQCYTALTRGVLYAALADCTCGTKSLLGTATGRGRFRIHCRLPQP